LTTQLSPDVVTEGLGAFDELEFLGAGTFGTTFRALRGDDEYAIKVIHAAGMPDYMWDREITSLSKVDHPNVVGFRTSGTFTFGGQTYPYFECEFIDGATVKDAITNGRRPANADEMRGFLSGLLAGIYEIHDLGIIHRDIKPANVGLREGDWGQPVLLDFGLARVLDMSTHTAYPNRIGTTMYMAPEQLRGERARQRSDLFAAGLVAYEAITGKHPFIEPGVSTLQSLHDRIRAGAPEDPRTVNAKCPADVAEVILRILSYQAHARLGVARAMRDLQNPT
jgi:serine/threonine-protein kinase